MGPNWPSFIVQVSGSLDPFCEMSRDHCDSISKIQTSLLEVCFLPRFRLAAREDMSMPDQVDASHGACSPDRSPRTLVQAPHHESVLLCNPLVLWKWVLADVAGK